MTWKLASAVLTAFVAATATSAMADSISEVEGARAHERSGHHLSRQDREKLRWWGRSSDGPYDDRYDYGYERGYRYGYADPYYGGGGVSVYIGPR
jgi:hypothetical protein